VLNLNTNITWKPVEDFETLYEIASSGAVRSLKTGRELKPCLFHGYLKVSLCKKGVITKHSVHRLVAKVFIANPSNKPQVNHIDGCKLTNTADNLEWVTCSENHKHAYTLGLKQATKTKAIGIKKGVSSKYLNVTHCKTDTEDKYQATISNKGFTRSRSFSVKKYGDKAEVLAALAVNTMIDTYTEFQNRPKNVIQGMPNDYS
jgi:hypothetical protein